MTYLIHAWPGGGLVTVNLAGRRRCVIAYLDAPFAARCGTAIVRLGNSGQPVMTMEVEAKTPDDLADRLRRLYDLPTDVELAFSGSPLFVDLVEQLLGRLLAHPELPSTPHQVLG